jgi:polyphosphate kinase 2 (PPK2 family)
LVERLRDPLKNWKFSVGDLEERKRWDEYTEAYEDVLERCGTEWAPWYLVPADRRKARDLLVAQAVVETLETLNPQFPQVDPDVLKIAREWERESAGRHRAQE